MQLSLSSAAAPDAALADLLAACARRGLAALELVEGHAHGVSCGRAWLGRAGGWGCGSKQSDPSLVTLERSAHVAGGGS